MQSLATATLAATFATAAVAADIPDDWSTHTIQPGETVSQMVLDNTDIAIGEGDKFRRSIEENNPHIENLDKVSPGQTIIIPNDINGFVCEIPTTDLGPDAARFERSMCALKALLG